MELGLRYTKRLEIAKAKSLSNLDFHKLASDTHPKIRLKIARRPDAPGLVLDQLSNDYDIGVRVAVGQNLNTSPMTLSQMIGDNNHNVLAAIVKNPNMPPDVLDKLADYDGPASKALIVQGRSMQGRVAKHNHTPFKTLERLAKDPDEWVRYAVLKNPKTPKRILHQLANASFSNEWLMRRILQRKFFSDSGFIEKLTHHESKHVRMLAFDSIEKTPEIIERMALDPFESIQSKAASNPKLSEESLWRCIRKGNWFVRCGAAQNPSLTHEMIEKLSWDEHYNPVAQVAKHELIPGGTLARLATHENSFVRRAVAAHKRTPEHVLKQLCVDSDSHVQNELLKNKKLSTLFLRANLKHPTKWTLEQLSARDAPNNYYQVANNPETPIDVLAELAEKRFTLEDMKAEYKDYDWDDERLLEQAVKARLMLLSRLASNKSISVELLSQVVKYAYDERDEDKLYARVVILSAICNPVMDASLIQEIFEQAESWERIVWVRQQSMHWRNFRLKHPYVIKRVISNCPVTPPGILAKLARHNCSRIRASVAKHPNTLTETLYHLAADDEYVVKLRVIHRDVIPKEIGAILQQDPVMGEIYEARIAGEYNDHKRRSHWIRR